MDKEVCRKAPITKTSMNLMPAMRKINLMIIPNKIRDRVGKCEQWPNRTTACLRGIVERVVLVISWTPMKILVGYLVHSVEPQQIGTRAKVPRMLLQT